jgi:YbbR domain-containing protein
MKSALTRNLGWKLLALLLALVLWFHLATEKTYERTFKARIFGDNLASNIFIDEISPEIIDVSIAASGKQIMKLMLSHEILIRLDLSGYEEPGEYTRYITQTDLYRIDASRFIRVLFTPSDRIKIILKKRS